MPCQIIFFIQLRPFDTKARTKFALPCSESKTIALGPNTIHDSIGKKVKLFAGFILISKLLTSIVSNVKLLLIVLISKKKNINDGKSLNTIYFISEEKKIF